MIAPDGIRVAVGRDVGMDHRPHDAGRSAVRGVRRRLPQGRNTRRGGGSVAAVNAPLRRSMTLDEFLAWEGRQEARWEFDGVRPVAMVGGSRPHAAIQRNLAISVGGRLRGTPCQFYGSDLKVEVDGAIRYPDGVVVCTPGGPVVRDPVVLFEVLSPGTQAVDRSEKNREYRATPSVRRYVMLEQDRVMATVFRREGEDWVGHVHYAGAVLAMPEIGVEVPLDELYADVEPAVPPRDDGDQASGDRASGRANS